MSSSTSFKLLDGEWPILSPAVAVPPTVMEAIVSDGLGSAITSYLGYLSLGQFYIDAELVEPHCSQRPVSTSHVNVLVDDFEKRGIFRSENSGVVIGLGEGWMEMKNNGPDIYKITKNSVHLPLLSLCPGGPIAQVIRGGHRTAAVQKYAATSDNLHEAYWLFTVLVPCEFKLFHLFYTI